MKKSVVYIAFFFLIFISKAQPATGNYKEFILWSDSLKLSWNDFKGTPIPNSAEAAMTASSMEFSYGTKGTKVTWNVTCKFFPQLSWVKQDKKSDYIFKHEHLHFDITELYARLFRKRLTENVRSNNDVSKMKIISKNIMKEWAEEQNKYDKETNHSINEEQQAIWNANVQKRLDELKAFATKP
jgi:hypothetical protein